MFNVSACRFVSEFGGGDHLFQDPSIFSQSFFSRAATAIPSRIVFVFFLLRNMPILNPRKSAKLIIIPERENILVS